MKKLTFRQRGRLARAAVRELAKKRRLQRYGLIVSADGIEEVRMARKGHSMPAQFCVVDNPEETIGFINALRDRLIRPPPSGIRSMKARLNGGRAAAPRWIGPYVDFANMASITPTSALILAAEYDRARRLNQRTVGRISKLFIVDPQTWNQQVLDGLIDVGFFDILGIGETSARSDDDRRILKFRSGQDNDAAEISAMLDEIEKMSADVGLSANDACFEMNGAIGEAMENAVRCAYPGTSKFRHPHVGRWWMTGAVSRTQRRMKVAIFDQGISIPGSLGNWKFYRSWADRARKALGFEIDLKDPKHDGRVIELAIEESASSTLDPKHGKGLGHIKAFVDQCTSGRLAIVSRRGMYIYEKGSAAVVKTLNADIGGTLVEWDVQI